MLHRGEESGVLHAIARAHARGAALIAPSGAAAALSSVMIAGGTSEEALRYGVTSDLGHPGLVIQEGIGFFSGGIVDQNLISSGRLGRLVVACAEENERFGVGVCEDSVAVARDGGGRLEARGRHGFVLVDTLASDLTLHSDSFVAKDIQLTMVGPGDQVDLVTGSVTRAPSGGGAPDLLKGLVANLARDLGARPRGTGATRRAQVRMREQGALSAVLDLESPRDEFDT
jgi:cyanophycinase-like exopeptidase